MGIKGLNRLIKYVNRGQPDNVKQLSSYSGSKVAIDTEGLLYKFRFVAQKQSVYNQQKYHIYAIVLHAIKFLNENIIPIYVFDGKPPEAKYENCLVKRYNDREKNLQNFLEIEIRFVEMIKTCSESMITNPEIIKLLEEYESAQNKCIVVSKLQRQECINILQLLGIPYINTSNAEAECVCVYLAKHKIVDYVLSEDTDCIVYGISSLENSLDHDIKILKKSSRTGREVIRADRTDRTDDYIELSCRHIIQLFKMTVEQFIDMCILCGCDYCPNLKLGPNACYKLIRDFKSIDNLQCLLSKTNDYNYVEARNILKNSSNNIQLSNDFSTVQLNSHLLVRLKNYVDSNKSVHNQ